MATIDWPWAILLCKFSDVPAEPQPPQYYSELYTANGTGGVCDYWRTVTCGTLDLSDSRVFGWFGMNHASSEVHSLVFPGERWKLVQWGIDAAQANGVDVSPFRSVLVVHNYGVDHGFAGNGVVIVHGDPAVCEFGFICHEMGHGHGLPHSWAANPDFQYGDGWDVMSFATTTFQFPITFNGTQGAATVGLNARNLEALGAVPAGRTWEPAGPDFSAALTLDPLNQPLLGSHGQLMARIPPSATRPARPSQSTYLVEFHRKAGWDQAIPQDAVSVREVRANGNSYLQPGMWGQLTANQEYVTPDPSVNIRVSGIDPAQGTASVRIWDLPDGCLRKEDSKPRVYLIENGAKRWVTSPAVLFALGRTWADVRSVPDGALNGIPDGPDVSTLTVTVSPHPVPLNRSVSVTVSAIDASTGTDVGGQIEIDGNIAGTTGTPFTRIFRRRRIRTPDEPRPEFEWIYPVGTVHAAGFPDTPIDFGFPDF
jgi:hypothetical protein